MVRNRANAAEARRANVRHILARQARRARIERQTQENIMTESERLHLAKVADATKPKDGEAATTIHLTDAEVCARDAASLKEFLGQTQPVPASSRPRGGGSGI
jgi:hypothetical protein